MGVIKEKSQFKYLFKYLTSLDAKCIIVEEEYISKDYLYDYTAYYATCHKPYEKKCKRLHFFNNEFSKEEFKKNLLCSVEEQKIFFSNYLGCVVAKPIPHTVFGITLLKTFKGSQNFNERNFWGTRKYKIHLFGTELEIDSLAFQEQDSVMAACATTAIWSMLNKACRGDYTILKSPGEITNDAGNILNDGSRLFPNKGLDKFQVCQAIFKAGLVCEVNNGDLWNSSVNPQGNVVPTVYLQKILNAYSSIGIPIILIIHVPTVDGYGLHAITVAGTNVATPMDVIPRINIRWVAENMEKFYAHDDQYGCFTKIKIKNHDSIITPWTENHLTNEVTYVDSIIVPLYPKIRIPYQDIELIVAGVDAIITIFFLNASPQIDLVWDIKLMYSEDWKNEIKISENLSEAEKIEIIMEHYPKYIWVARCYYGVKKIFDLAFDATDVSNGMIGLNGIIYINDAFRKKLHEHILANEETFLNALKHQAKNEYYQYLLKVFLKS